MKKTGGFNFSKIIFIVINWKLGILKTCMSVEYIVYTYVRKNLDEIEKNIIIWYNFFSLFIFNREKFK